MNLNSIVVSDRQTGHIEIQALENAWESVGTEHFCVSSARLEYTHSVGTTVDTRRMCDCEAVQLCECYSHTHTDFVAFVSAHWSPFVCGAYDTLAHSPKHRRIQTRARSHIRAVGYGRAQQRQQQQTRKYSPCSVRANATKQ